jgi:hypothetical protein
MATTLFESKKILIVVLSLITILSSHQDSYSQRNKGNIVLGFFDKNASKKVLTPLNGGNIRQTALTKATDLFAYYNTSTGKIQITEINYLISFYRRNLDPIEITNSGKSLEDSSRVADFFQDDNFFNKLYRIEIEVKDIKLSSGEIISTPAFSMPQIKNKPNLVVYTITK